MSAVKKLRYGLISEDGLAIGGKVTDGKILPALSVVSTLAQPKGMTFAACDRHSRKIFTTEGKTIYIADEGGAFKQDNKFSGTVPYFINYRTEDGVTGAFACNSFVTYQQGETRVVKSFPQKIGGGVFKNGRVFAIDLNDRQKMRWSGEGGISDWTEKIDGAGWLYTETELGDIFRLFVLNGQIAAVKKFGISLISAYGTPENFKVTLSVPTADIYDNTAAVCGNKLYFYSKDGLCAFDGSGVEKLDLSILQGFSEPQGAASSGDEFYLGGYLEELKRRVVLVYNVKEKSAYFCDVPARCLCVGDSVYAFSDDGVATLGTGGEFTYKSKKFGEFSKRKKALKSIFIKGGTADITVETESGERTFYGVFGTLYPNMRGRYFQVTVRSFNPIEELYANVEYF